MPLKIKKIAAFSLIELLIALVISVIVVSISYMILRIVVKNVDIIQTNYMQTNEMHLASEQLLVDFNRATQINLVAQDNMLHFQNPIEKILYTFEDSFLLRNNDTLLNKILDKRFFFLGKESTSGSIDAIKLYMEPESQNLTIFIAKENDAITKMQVNGN